ncbi:HD domain-containing protein [Mucilaginibacter sp. cycad4]|uniref:HD domain-containing protein n=1 Tax=Mucilaginibacter sp. cycad4 TaxID=3342096 RepID=UPI002AABA2FD|nr:HD domain-containing protein [Mucilaginibacter gossypii]WPU99179.1 HD domain-containing protein [Mucilaginibacter gossypii]
MFSDIKIPDSSIIRQAEEYAREKCGEMLYHHVMRCYYFGRLFAQQENAKIDNELMFLSAVLHDLGFAHAGGGSNRFEIEGAHAARKFLLDRGVSDDFTWKVWHNIALHTTDISLYKDDASRCSQFGILYDIIALPPEIKLDPRDVAEIVHLHPRMDFKKGFYGLLSDELDRKKPYPNKMHFCACIDYHKTGFVEIPDPAILLNSAPFDE